LIFWPFAGDDCPKRAFYSLQHNCLVCGGIVTNCGLSTIANITVPESFSGFLPLLSYAVGQLGFVFRRISGIVALS
jgi:hypothetical protein